MNSLFDIDPYPDGLKILFIGSGTSTHTYSWINLLDETRMNVRLFALPGGNPPSYWNVRTYTTVLSRYSPEADTPTRRRVYYQPSFGIRILNRLWDTFVPGPDQDPSRIEKKLAEVIFKWKPDIIHTLGFDSASFFYQQVCDKHGVGDIGKWVAQARGGPDFKLNQYLPEKMEKIRRVLRNCDKFIADNQPNYDFAIANGLDASKLSLLGVVSGMGGVDVEQLKGMWTDLPSRRGRIIVLPKTYEAPSSKALPVFEAIKLAWDEIKPCEIHMLWMVQPEVRIWHQTLPIEIQQACHLYERIPRQQALDLVARARVLLAPSLTDGIPNSMLEAMALGAFPVVSPLDTITPVVREPENVLFARNLYPHEIASSLIRAMNNDRLVDDAAKANLQLVSRISNRAQIRPKLIEFYESLASLLP